MQALAEAFSSGGLAGLLLLALVVQAALFLKGLSARDKLIADMVEKLGAVSERQADANLQTAVALSRIEAALQIEKAP